MNKPQQADNARLMRLATYAAVFTAVLLIIVKIIAWFMTDSVSILAALVDSSLDVLASIVSLIAVHQALQPADSHHRFGHGKAEALAGLGQAMFITGSAAVLLLQAISRLWSPQSTATSIDIGILVMVFSMVMTLLLVMFQRYVVKKTNSVAIKADSLHYKTDLFMNAGVIVALLLTYWGWPHFDPLFAIGIALFILFSAWTIGRQAVDLLMDHELPETERERICSMLLSHPKVRGFHDLRTRRSGTTVFVQLHLELDETLSLREAHQIADGLEKKVAALFIDAEVIIHEDPVDLQAVQTESV